MHNKDGQIFYSKSGMLQITLNGPGCYYQKHGCCKMCNYGGGNDITLRGAVKFVDRAIRRFSRAKRILIGSNGSLLDEREIPKTTIAAVLDCINRTSIKNVYIETHAHTVNVQNLLFLKEKLPEKNITIEMGLESSNQYVLTDIIGKSLKTYTIIEAIRLIHDHGMNAALNVLFGIWNVDEGYMKYDFIRTCNWANEAGADEIVIFLLHIKRGTYVYELYKQGKLSPPKHTDFIATLSELDDQILQKAYFSWFGERKEAINEYSIITPDYDGLNPEDTTNFYCRLMRSEDVSKKRKLIKSFLQPH